MLLKWSKIPDLASLHGAVCDSMNEFVHWFMLILFVGWTTFLAYVFWRYRAKKRTAEAAGAGGHAADYHGVRSHATTHVEIGVVIIEAILLIGFALPFWFQQASAFPTGPEVVRVRAVGFQFGWAFHYPGPDGKFGRVHHDLYVTDPVGVDRTDPNGQDDIVAQGNLTLPIDRPAVIQITSKDVIHSLSIHAVRSCQDAIPGTEIPMWFTPTQIGEWDIVCAQLCGAGHASMKATFTTIPAADWDKWVQENAPKPATTAPAAAVAPATN